MSLSFPQLLKIEELIENKKWNESKKNERGGIIADLVLKLFARTSDDDQFSLIENLLNRFIVCKNYDEYSANIANSIKEFFNGTKIVLIPIIDKSEKIKSGHNLVYELERFLDRRDYEKLITRESLEYVTDVKSYNILVIDDFIGSGNQFISFFNDISRSYGVTKDQISIYTIASMEAGLKSTEPFCRSHSCQIKLNRAISDNLSAFSIPDPLLVYDKIESALKLSSKFRRGYEQSEALISMKKTPNNCRPIFWHGGVTGAEECPAIFPR